MMMKTNTRFSDFTLESITIKTLKARYNKLDARKQEDWSPTDMNLYALLSLDPEKSYTIDDLDHEETLDRALRLLFLARYGQRQQHFRISPHISYDRLPQEVSKRIEAKLII